MGDLPKPSDEATWTEVERSFFAAAPPEEPQPPLEVARFGGAEPQSQRPRRAVLARLRPSVGAARRRVTLAFGAAGALSRRAWRGTRLAFGAAGGQIQRARRRAALIVGAVGARARHTARAAGAGLVAALSIWRVERRAVAFALAGAVMVVAFSAGVVAFRRGGLTNRAPVQSEGPVSGPAVVQAAPVAVAAAPATRRANARPSADVRAPRADVSNRRPHAHRGPVPAASSTRRPVMTAFMDRETYWAREPRSAPARSSRPFFSR